jgi:hypothetical protein
VLAAVVASGISVGVPLLLWLVYGEDLAAWITASVALVTILLALAGHYLAPRNLRPASHAWLGYDGTLSAEPLDSAILTKVTRGVLAFNPPSEMRLGITEGVEVGIARSDELRDALLAELEGRGEVQHQEIPTSSFMSVHLSGGKAFDIDPVTEVVEQVVEPTARWQFDVTPLRTGMRKLHLSVSYRIEVSGTSHAGFKAVPVVERDIRVRVNVRYVVAHNRKWLITTAVAAVAAAGTVAAAFH